MYLLIAILSYFLTALANILDKFLLSSKRMPSPAVYAFYTGIFGIISLVLYPFGFQLPSIGIIILCLASGAVFTYGLLLFYYAVQKGETSKVAPLTGGVLGVITYIISTILLEESLNNFQLVGIGILVAGSFLISLAGKKSKQYFSQGTIYAATAGVALATAFGLFKVVYEDQNFINGFIWTRFGLVLGSFSLFLIPRWRKEIMNVLSGFRKKQSRKKNTYALILALFNKLLGGTGSILVNLAIAMGSVVVVNSLISIQFVFVFILASLLSVKKPEIFAEELKRPAIIKKAIAIAIIGIGVTIISLF